MGLAQKVKKIILQSFGDDLMGDKYIFFLDRFLNINKHIIIVNHHLEVVNIHNTPA